MDKESPLVTIDTEQIKQVPLNLAINALQVMPEGGQLTFRTKNTNEFLTVEVEDEGGFYASIAQPIFDPFFTPKEKVSGLGFRSHTK